MRKLICALLALALVCGAAFAEIVYVTVSDGSGEFRLADTATEVTDVDGDGALSVYDALYCAHEQYFEGGAAAGFAAEDQGYGPSLTKLWGIDNGGSYGYYVNNNSCMNLDEPVEEGVHVQAYCYQDLEGWSDMFSYFELRTSDADAGSYGVTLYGVRFDADGKANPVPVEGAKITIDGADAGAVTDEAGAASFTIAESGVHIVSAKIDGSVLVPPILTISQGIE